MLAEGFVALIALVTIMIASPALVKGLPPGTIYGNGIGEFLTLILGRENLAFAVTFGAMAFSTFVFDTLDVSTRLGRYIVQELFGFKGRGGAMVATLVTLSVPLYVLSLGGEGGWTKFWTLFGASNQLLAALTLLALTVWLRNEKKAYLFTLLPMAFVLTITLLALGQLAVANLRAIQGLDVALANALASMALIALAIYLVAVALRHLRSGSPRQT
jgi:carbon starvation protein